MLRIYAYTCLMLHTIGRLWFASIRGNTNEFVQRCELWSQAWYTGNIVIAAVALATGSESTVTIRPFQVAVLFVLCAPPLVKSVLSAKLNLFRDASVC